ncbi:MAG: winged helix-turn-helix transcriptional regulator [Nitrospiraceae bacterium]|nr:MAG: winged helix-turn-helix transcriptional regulator [Nitrospiraceae bacterium]
MNKLGEKIEALKVIAHPARIAILEELSQGVKCVSDFQDFLEIRQSNVSQHLSALRHAGLIDYFIDGRLRCYFLKSPFILDLLEIVKKDYPCELPGPDCCPVTKKGTYPGDRRR